ncbi:ABC-2 family transporter [Aneurinibacillus soli]|uniref:ABC-2 family transporter protein n=1 Tax=Aneurinibacillus soli TaxID=1500254 RepID=A0A0U5B6D6_9BACL|nr:ABC-2 family transporter [Aneurinibacillus soli]BAU26397.1 ABC-2 family transporter protein [Aneurinibacillus soli]
MRNIWKIRLLLWMRDWVFVALVLLLPILFMLVMGAAGSFEPQPVIAVAVADEDRTDYSKLVIERFSGKEGLRVIQGSESDVKKLAETYKVEAAFVIRKGFKEAILNEEIRERIDVFKNPGSLSYGILEEMLGSEVARLSANAEAANMAVRVYREYELSPVPEAALWERVRAYTDAQWEPKPLLTLEEKKWTADRMPKVANVVPVSSALLAGIGILLVLLMLLLLLSSAWLIEEREAGILRRARSVPGMLGKLYMGSVLAQLTIAAVVVLFCAGIAYAGFGTGLLPHPLLYVLLAVYMVTASGIGMAIAVHVRSSGQLAAAAPLAAILTGFVGGCFWAFLPVPDALAMLALCTPQGWALSGVKEWLAGESVRGFETAGGVLLLMGILLHVYSFWRVQAKKA